MERPIPFHRLFENLDRIDPRVREDQNFLHDSSFSAFRGIINEELLSGLFMQFIEKGYHCLADHWFTAYHWISVILRTKKFEKVENMRKKKYESCI